VRVGVLIFLMSARTNSRVRAYSGGFIYDAHKAKNVIGMDTVIMSGGDGTGENSGELELFYWIL
jgi:hypothetical protein